MVYRPGRQGDVGAIELLETVPEHRTVSLLEDQGSYVNAVVRADTKNVSIVGGMMDLAERKPVGDDRGASVIVVGDDVSGIKQFNMTESTDRASAAICIDDNVSKRTLVETVARQPPCIAA